MYTFGELITNVATLVQRSGDSGYDDKIKVWINLGLMRLYNIYDYYLELKGEHNFTTSDGVARYYTPNDFEKPLRFFDITNNKKITITTHEEYFDANIANIADANEDSATQAYFTEVVGVKVQVATTGDTVQAKSSSASDTSVVVRIEGYLDSSLTILGFENITVTGTTATTATSPNTFYKITHVSKDDDTSGYITLEDSSANTLTTLDQIGRVSHHKAFDLGLIPDDSTTDMRILYKKKFRKLVDDNDYPFIEADDFLIFNAASLAMQQEKEMIERAGLMAQQAERAFFDINSNQTTKLGPDFQHQMVWGITQAHRS